MGGDDVVKLLIVDDEERNLDALETILASSGCFFVRARTADEALLAVLHNHFAAIILDIKMPGTSGLELARLIKARKRNRHIPILFLTAYTMDEREVLEAYGVGGVDYLSKPINPEILRSKVTVFVDLFKATQALASAVEALHSEIAEREKVQEQLALAKTELEDRVLARTAELARATQEIRDNEERLKLAMDVAQMAAWEWNLETGKMRWSADPETVFGFPPGAFGSDSKISHAIHEDDISVLEEAVRQAMLGKDLQVDYRAVRPDGSTVWIADRGRVIQDEAGKPARIVGVSVDLTTRKMQEQMLQDSENALRETDRRKDEFLATLAHELRNPIAPIRYAVQVMNLKAAKTPELQWTIDVIERQTQHMARLIDDLLDVNRITRNSLELRKDRCELAAVISGAIETSRPLIERGGLELSVSLPPEPVFLDADIVRLAQVFSNLLNNAAKYGKGNRDTGHIWLSAEMSNETVAVTIRDTGVGIAPAMLPKIFDMFTQVGRSIEQSVGGLGIGLSLAKRLVELHGGSIEARSEGLGRGSQFVVRLPVAASEAEPAPSVVEEALPAVMEKRRVLLADDNPDVAEAFEVMLQMLGHEVAVAHDGVEAVEVAERFRPSVIILDIGMPKMNGYDAARRIRRQPWAAHVALIALTGWGDEKDKRKSEEAGFNFHLVKPVDPVALTHLLDSLAHEQPDQPAYQRKS